MIGLVHGYGLSGAGSNLWTRSVVRALCELGETVHLICQESRPEQFGFITEAYRYDADASRETLFERGSDFSGRCIFHRPVLDVLPTYVRPQTSSDYVVSILDLDDSTIEGYLDRNARVLEQVVREHAIDALHVNHVVLLAEAARRVKERVGVPYAVMPHGSAIEYVVKKNAAMQRLASGALAAADRVFALNREMRSRLGDVFPDVSGLRDKMSTLRVGVDTRQFQVVSRDERRRSIDRLAEVVADRPRGKAWAQTEQLHACLSDEMEQKGFRECIAASSDYTRAAPDADLEARLNDTAWEREHAITFVGRLIAAKGLPAIVTALPSILARYPETRLVAVGSGPLREVMEAFVWALATGRRRLARDIVRWGNALENDDDGPYAAPHAFFEQLGEDGRTAYFERAERLLQPGRVLFTGFLEHDALCHLFPCSDVAVFPSVVAEASPLVVPEAAASGCFPMGTDFAGMHDSLDAMAEGLPVDVADLMRLRPEPEHTVQDIIDNVTAVFGRSTRHADVLRRIAVEQFDWHEIARTMERELDVLAQA